MPNTRPTPELRLTHEKREQLRRLAEVVEHGTAPVITHEADLAARAFREIERLRAEAETATQEAYDKGRRDERKRIVRLLQEMCARHYQMAFQERDRWVRMAHYDQAGAIEEAICRIAFTEWTMTDVRTEAR